MLGGGAAPSPRAFLRVPVGPLRPHPPAENVPRDPAAIRLQQTVRLVYSWSGTGWQDKYRPFHPVDVTQQQTDSQDVLHATCPFMGGLPVSASRASLALNTTAHGPSTDFTPASRQSSWPSRPESGTTGKPTSPERRRGARIACNGSKPQVWPGPISDR